MKRFAVILAGCGVFDGSEIHEAVLTMLAIRRHGAEYEIFAPDVPQTSVVNHLTGQPMDETRNVLVESARIARGKIRPLSEYRAEEFDALILPGGFGAAKNLCDYAYRGTEMAVDPEVERAVRETSAAGKKIGALCIAPVILASLFPGVTITFGEPCEDSEATAAMGAVHVPTSPTGVVVDEERGIFTGPCYMADASIDQIADCAHNVVGAMMKG